jgi:iron complex outermembrane receptor protein
LRAAIAALCAGSAGAMTHIASAQQAGADSGGGLEEIVVTATRRAQDLQEVPISIVAVTGEGLETRGIQYVENLNATIPNLSVMGQAGGQGTAQTSFRVRGIPNVGTYIDGIWQISTLGVLNEEFTDIDRLEVLRGPQGTLFGRDSVGGAVRIFTKRPSDEFGGTFKGTVGTYNRHDATITANLPFSDNVKSKWTFSDLNRDGYITSLTTGAKGGGIDQSTLRGDLVFTPTDKLDIRVQASRQQDEFIEPRVADAVWLDTAFSPATAGKLYDNAGLSYNQVSQMSGWPGGTVGKWENRSEITIPNKIVKDQASLDVKLALTDDLSLDFLTGYTDQTAKIFVDYDNSQYGLVEDTSNQHIHFISQEVQLSGGKDRVKWVAGLFYWDESRRTRSVSYAFEEFNADPITRADNANVAALYASPFCQALFAADPRLTVPGTPTNCQNAMAFYKPFSTLTATVPGSAIPARGGRLSELGTSGLAFFGEVSLSLTDKFTLTVGAREHDQDNYSQVMSPTGQAPLLVNHDFATDPLAGVPDGQRTPSSFDKATGRVSAQYQFTNDIMGYASFSQGFNSGNAVYVNIPGTNELRLYNYKPETLNNFEVGIRSDLADGHVRLNATLFDTNWEDIQVSLALRTCDPSGNNCTDTRSVVPQNVGTAHARGTEIELIYVPTSALTFNVNIGLLDTGYDKITVPTAAAYVPGQTEFSQAPERTYNVGIQHDASLKNGGSLTTRFDYTYVSQYWRSPDPTLRVAWYAGNSTGILPGYSDESGDFGQFNARLTYSPVSNKWDVSVFGTNLTNEYQLNSGFFHGLWGYDFAAVARPRELGASLTFRF